MAVANAARLAAVAVVYQDLDFRTRFTVAPQW
jgi:hypothetical protein